MASASSLTVPRSRTSRTPAESAARAGRLEHPELEELVAGEVDAGRAERRDHRAPAGPEVAPGQRPARRVVALHDAAGGVGVQREVHDGLRLLAPPGEPDERVDVLRAQLDCACPSGRGPGSARSARRRRPGRTRPRTRCPRARSACCGRLPNSHADSRSETRDARLAPRTPPDTPGRDRLGSGLVKANSAFTSSREGAVAGLGGQAVQQPVTPVGLEVELRC